MSYIKKSTLLEQKIQELNSLNQGSFTYQKVLDSFALNDGKYLLCSKVSTIPKFISFIDDFIQKLERKKQIEELFIQQSKRG